MPRTYIKKTSRGNFKEEQVEAAINAVKEGKSIREAGRTYGIAESTIRLRMKRRCLKLERRIKHEANDFTYYYKPVDGESYDTTGQLTNSSQVVKNEENDDMDMENSSNMYTFIPEAHFQTSDQSGMEATYIPETSYETPEHVIKIENAPRLKKRLCQSSDQRQLDSSEQRICSAIEELREISASARSMEREDEFDIFGRSVAAQLRQLPIMDALSIQLKLQTILTEARIRASQNQARRENGMMD